MNPFLALPLWSISVVFILVIYIWGFKIYSEKKGMRVFLIFSMLGAILMPTDWLYIPSIRHQDNIKYLGAPIGMTSRTLDGHIFTPLAFVITEHRILVYDKDEKVYALDGIKLDKDLTPETLTVGSNISYTVFTKAGQLYFGRVGS